MSARDIVFIALLAWNGLVFCLYGSDKARARAKRRRIPERTLLGCAFCLGAVGALLGMSCFRHKTKHRRFRLLVPMALLVNGAAIWVLLTRVWPLR